MQQMGVGKSWYCDHKDKDRIRQILSMDVKYEGKFREEQNIYIILKCLPDCLLDAEMNKTVITEQHLDRMIKTDITSVLLDVIPQGHDSLYAAFQSMCGFNLTTWKHQTNTKSRIFNLKRKREETTFFKMSMS